MTMFFTSLFSIFTLLLILFSRSEYYFLEALGIVFLSIVLLIVLIRTVLTSISKINKPIVKWTSSFFLFGFALFYLCIVVSVVWIRFDVRTQCQDAKREYGGDCVVALLDLLQDENRGFRARNNAIFALGQLGDSRAFPVLKQLYTGAIPPRERLDAGISQYELRKAVNLTSGGINIPAFLWRYGID